ncbi:orotate phosphoribosyltransferase [Bifidobacterium tibiigranuli]|uniref:orotate phosphoribosyltransferase n=1 Tax=Bifidobacterium tibiigranuli TaxID=2172043 RepID=UPI0026F2239C|nr:orotate phosphoribosyltransferase [Bifidobacterium tibiigranuli]MCI1713117.1 orotate phosphoribosyltransferase [Bifidobacterium tibiigranuli]
MAKGTAMSADERGVLPESGDGGQGTDARIGVGDKDELRQMLREAVSGKPFSELSAVTFDQRGVALAGEAVLDALHERGFNFGDFDAVGALTAAAVPLVIAVMHAAASQGKSLDGFVMDFVYPSIKGPSIRGKRVILLDSWLSEKSYVQTSSLVTLRNGNELNLDFSIVEHEQAQVLAIVTLIGGLGANGSTSGGAGEAASDGIAAAETAKANKPGSAHTSDDASFVEVVDTINDSRHAVPFIQVFEERELR